MVQTLKLPPLIRYQEPEDERGSEQAAFWVQKDLLDETCLDVFLLMPRLKMHATVSPRGPERATSMFITSSIQQESARLMRQVPPFDGRKDKLRLPLHSSRPERPGRTFSWLTLSTNLHKHLFQFKKKKKKVYLLNFKVKSSFHLT